MRPNNLATTLCIIALLVASLHTNAQAPQVRERIGIDGGNSRRPGPRKNNYRPLTIMISGGRGLFDVLIINPFSTLFNRVFTVNCKEAGTTDKEE